MSRYQQTLVRLGSVSVPALCSALATSANAQAPQASGEPALVEELVVSARRIEEKIHEVPAGMTYTCCMTLLTAGDRIAAERPEGREAIHRFVREIRRSDLCITDAKGDRSLSPKEQPDPDACLRVIERRPEGVVIRGAKLHVSLAAIGHELMVIPTKSMKPGEEDYSIACVVPADAEGVKIVTVGAPPRGDLRGFPVSARDDLPQCFVVVDDVFVQRDAIFPGVWAASGAGFDIEAECGPSSA